MQLISVVRVSICFKYNWNGKKKWHYRESQLLQIVLLSFRPYKFLGTYRSCTAVPTSLTRFSKGISSFCPQAGASTAGDWRGDELEREFKAKNPFRNGFAIIHFRLSFHRDKPWQNKDCFILQCIKCWENRQGRYFPCWGLREVATVSHAFTYSMDYFCSVSLGGGWRGLVVWALWNWLSLSCSRRGRRKEMSREKTTRDGIGGESEFPHLGPLPLPLFLLTFSPTLWLRTALHYPNA